MKRKKNPQEKQFNVRITAEQHEELRRYTFNKNVSVSELVKELLVSQNVISPTVKLFS